MSDEGAAIATTATVKPCPWCGGTDLEFQSKKNYRYGAAACVLCGIVGPEIRRVYGAPVAWWRDDALAAWNNRKEIDTDGSQPTTK